MYWPFFLIIDGLTDMFINNSFIQRWSMFLDYSLMAALDDMFNDYCNLIKELYLKWNTIFTNDDMLVELPFWINKS